MERFPQNSISEHIVFTRRIGLTGVARTIASLKGLVILPILAKTLGPSDFGIWAQILVTVSLLQPIIQLGLPYSMVRFLPSKEKGEIGQGVLTALSMILITSTVAFLAIFLSSDFLASNLLKSESSTGIIRLASLLIILEALNTAAIDSFRLFGQIKRYSIILLSQTALEIGLIAAFVLSGNGLFGAVISLVITKGVMLLVILYLVVSHAGFSRPAFSMLRPYLAYGLPLVPTAIFTFVIAASDRYVIGFFMGAASVGIYTAAYSIGYAVALFVEYISYILAPTIFNLFDKGRTEDVRTYLSYSWKYLLMLSIPAAFGLSMLAEPLLTTLTTVEFATAARFVIPIIAFGTIFQAISVMFGHVVRFSKKTRIFPLVYGTSAALNLGLNILLIPYWGITAAAITTLISYALCAVIMYYQARKYFSFDYNTSFVVKSIISSLAMAALIWAINPASVISIAFSIAGGVVVYFAVLLLLRGLSIDEVRFFLRAFKGALPG